MEAKLYGQNKGGMSINGIIKDYYVYAGENISVGDLVEYVNGVAGKTDYGESSDTQLATATNSGKTISAVRLDDYRIFIAHSSGSNENLHAMVVTIEGKNIVKGTDIVLSSASNTGSVISTCLLPNGNVFIAHSYDSNYYYLYGIVCKIDGTTITKGTDKKIVDATYTGQTISACTLLNGNVFIAYSTSSSNRYLHGIVCTISDTSIGTGSATNLSGNVSKTGIAISTCLLPNGNVFIAHSYGSSYYLYGIVCSISGTTITKGSDTAIVSSTNAGSHISTCLLANGNVFIAHSYDSSWKGIAITIDGTIITIGTDTTLVSGSISNPTISTCLLTNGNVFAVYSYGSYTHLYGMVVSIDGVTITKGTNTQLKGMEHSGYASTCLLLDNGTIFIPHSETKSKYYLYAQIFTVDENNIPTNHIIATEYETQVRKVTTGQFDGIAKTSGEGSPEFVEGEVKKTGNAFPTSGWNEEVAYTKYSTDDGYVIEADSAYSNQYPVTKAFDDDASNSSYWRPTQSATGNIQITCPKPIKITKMKTYVRDDYSGSYFKNAIIQGSVNGSEWIDLYTISNSQTSLTEITLSNTDFYTYYKMTVTLSSSGREIRVDEWQTSEYIEKGLVPSTGHKDIVSIWTMPQEVLVQGDIIPKTWTYISDTEYVSEDGTRLITSSYRSPGTLTYEANLGCDGDETTNWLHASDDLTPTFTLIFPTAVKVLKMNICVSFGYIENLERCQIVGSNDGVVWETLYEIKEQMYPMSEIVLSNPDFYKMYRVEAVFSEILNMAVYELQTSEYIVLE